MSRSSHQSYARPRNRCCSPLPKALQHPPVDDMEWRAFVAFVPYRFLRFSHLPSQSAIELKSTAAAPSQRPRNAPQLTIEWYGAGVCPILRSYLSAHSYTTCLLSRVCHLLGPVQTVKHIRCRDLGGCRTKGRSNKEAALLSHLPQPVQPAVVLATTANPTASDPARPTHHAVSGDNSLSRPPTGPKKADSCSTLLTKISTMAPLRCLQESERA